MRPALQPATMLSSKPLGEITAKEVRRAISARRRRVAALRGDADVFGRAVLDPSTPESLRPAYARSLESTREDIAREAGLIGEMERDLILRDASEPRTRDGEN